MALIVSTRNLFFSSVHKAFIGEKFFSSGALLPGRHIRTALSFLKFEAFGSMEKKLFSIDHLVRCHCLASD